MNKMNNSFQCMQCNKYYSSKSSLCNHNKKFHNLQVLKSSDEIPINSDNIPINSELKKYICILL